MQSVQLSIQQQKNAAPCGASGAPLVVRLGVPPGGGQGRPSALAAASSRSSFSRSRCRCSRRCCRVSLAAAASAAWWREGLRVCCSSVMDEHADAATAIAALPRLLQLDSTQ